MKATMQQHSHQTPRSSTPEVIANVETSTVNPTILLNLYCAELLRRQNQTSPTTTPPQHQCIVQRLNEPLRIIDFLLGNSAQPGHQPSSSSVMEGALQIIDHCFLNFANMNNDIGSLSNTTTHGSNKNRRDKNHIGTISRMQSPAGRSLYLFSKGSKSGAKNCACITSSVEQDVSSYYLCFLSDEGPTSDTHNIPHLSYCSCRSFLERNRTTLSHGVCNGDRTTRVSLCKHLLTIKLISVFRTTLGNATERANIQFNIPTMEFASEEDYSRAIIQRLID